LDIRLGAFGWPGLSLSDRPGQPKIFAKEGEKIIAQAISDPARRAPVFTEEHNQQYEKQSSQKTFKQILKSTGLDGNVCEKP
jgi:hypothetical protein